MLVGNGGSGKSWLSTRIAETTGLPLYHLDKEFWQPGWVMPPEEEQVARLQQILSTDDWIIDGDYGATMPMRFDAADLVIFLDINRALCLLSALRRTGKRRADLPDYLTEPTVFSYGFWHFCSWIWRYPSVGRPKVLALHRQHPNTPFWRVTSRRQASALAHLNL